jgi:hypothetical protein
MKQKPLTDAEIEARINVFFDLNYEMLKLEGGHSMTSDSLEMARVQAILYWRRLRDVATSVTETEVKLTLPNKRTPAGRKFGIEGVVDIVSEGGRTVMYDLKTHAPEQIRANSQPYAQQLNVYAHIWQMLRRQHLDEQCVICTQAPRELRDEMLKPQPDPRRLQGLLAQWNPFIEIEADAGSIDETVRAFGEVVDQIEDGAFGPPLPARLNKPAPGGKLPYARDICRNCDARFSCSAYRTYIKGSTSTSQFERQFKPYLEDYGEDDERILRRVTAQLDEA